MRIFEVPYNFDKNNIDKFSKHKEHITFVYLPAYIEDMTDARRYTKTCYSQYPDNRQDYEEHVKYILDAGLRPGILLQHPYEHISDETLNYYLNLGVRDFIVGQDSLAERIKNIDKDINVVASVTKCLTLKELEKNNELYEKLYNSIVLFFPFNRALRYLKKLPKNLNYTFMMANICSYDCKLCMKHWFTNYDPCENCRSAQTENSLITATDMYLFDEYAHSYKIQGRELSSDYVVDFLERCINQPYGCQDDGMQRFEYENKHTGEKVDSVESRKIHFNTAVKEEFFKQEVFPPKVAFLKQAEKGSDNNEKI